MNIRIKDKLFHLYLQLKQSFEQIKHRPIQTDQKHKPEKIVQSIRMEINCN